MVDRSRHVPLRRDVWDQHVVVTAIQEIIEDAHKNFDEQTFWPSHPQEDGLPDGETSLYFGAVGNIWALDYLHRVGATPVIRDFRPSLPGLIEKTRGAFAKMPYPEHGSIMFGDMGALLLAMRLCPDPKYADEIHTRATANTDLPIRELMWGMPGSMLACVFMHRMTGEPRWRALFERQAARLLAELEETPEGPLWTQDLYGSHERWLGPVHGYAGNMVPLLHGWDWLTPEQKAKVTDAIRRTLTVNACESESGQTWQAVVGEDRPSPLCQHCHGAPGMVTTFCDAPFTDPEFEQVLRRGGEHTWQAGPLAKGSNLCHGTGGNGYALLKLHRRTGEADWLDRARSFAMTAIDQCRTTRKQHGQGRYSLWTGDVGLAVYLWNCITVEPRFPTIDVF